MSFIEQVLALFSGRLCFAATLKESMKLPRMLKLQGEGHYYKYLNSRTLTVFTEFMTLSQYLLQELGTFVHRMIHVAELMVPVGAFSSFTSDYGWEQQKDTAKP